MYSRNNTELTKLSSLNEMYHRMLLVPGTSTRYQYHTVPLILLLYIIIVPVQYQKLYSCLLNRITTALSFLVCCDK